MDPYDISLIFAQMENDLITSMIRNLAGHEAEEKKMGFTWEQWQKRKLQALAKYSTDNKKQMNAAGQKINQEVANLIKESFLQGGSQVENSLRRLGRSLQDLILAGKITEPITQVGRSDSSFFKINQNRIDALVKAAQKDMKKAQYAMLRKADDVYRQTIYKSQLFLNTGSVSLNKAIDMATKDFLAKGFDCITYKNGAKVNVTSYAEMALRASSQKAILTGAGSRRKEWGIHTILVSAHPNTCELCSPWQGRVLIDNVYSGGKKGEGSYPLLSTAMDAGLFHPRCTHNTGTYIEGVSSLPKPVNRKEESYGAIQKQKALERQIRMYKRMEAGSLDPDNQVKYSEKVKEWQDKLKEHLKANQQLSRDYTREIVINGISVKQRNENLKLAEQSAKIKGIREYIQSDTQPKTINTGQQNKHIPGTNEYKQYQKSYTDKDQHGPSVVSLSLEEVQELVSKHAGTGGIKFNNKGTWNKKETILDNDVIVGKIVNNITGAEAETTVFTIHYGRKGVHIVPDYPSKKGGANID